MFPLVNYRLSNLLLLFQAYEIFAQKERVREQVFVLGRMGNAKEALSTIINKLEDMQEVLPCLSVILPSCFILVNLIYEIGL